MTHDFEVLQRIRIPAFELLGMIEAHLGQEIPNSATIMTSRQRDGAVTDVTITWASERDVHTVKQAKGE